MINNEKLKELVNTIKLARKYSLIGEYGYSLEKYQEAIIIIKKRQEEIANENDNIKEKWKMTEYNIKSEMLQIKDILQTCLQLHHSEFCYSKIQNEGNSYYSTENKKIIEKEVFDMFSKDKKLYEKDKVKNYSNNKNNNTYAEINKRIKEKEKSKSSSNNKIKSINFISDSKKNNKNYKANPFQSSKNNFNNKYSALFNSNKRNYINVIKSQSLKEPSEVKMFNPLEEFYGRKLNDDDIININKGQNINGKEKNDKIGLKQKIKIVRIDLDQEELKNNQAKKLNKIEEPNNENIKEEINKNNNGDIIEQAMMNFSKLNLDNTNDSI